MNRHSLTTRTAIALSACIGLIFASAGCHQSAAETPKNGNADGESIQLTAEQLRSVRTEKVSLSTFHRTIDTTGTVAFDQDRSTQVLAPISGPVSRLLVEVGNRVSKGEPLASVASPDFAADVSALKKADAAAKNARRIADLDHQLFASDAISRRDLEQAETDAVSAEADRDAALQQLRALGVDEKALGDLERNHPVTNPGGMIRSPLAGTVVEKLITPGQLLQAGATPCFTVADLSTVWVMANVFDADLPYVAVGDSAEVTIGAGQPPLQAKVEYIAAFVDPNTRAVAVRLGVPNPGEVLKRDLYVSAAIHSRKEVRGLLIPVSALLRDEQNLPFVFISRPDGNFVRRQIQAGARIGDRQEVTSGLTAGDTIVVEGGLFLSSVEHP